MWLTPPQEDGQVQAQRIQQAVNDGADAILISCSDAGKVTGAINDAVDRGVPVMTFDSDAPQSKRFAYYGVDDVATGQQMMAELAKLHGRQGQGRDPRRQPERAEPAEARAGREGRGGEASRASQIVGMFNHIETPQDAAAEVVRVNNAYPDIQGWAMIGGWPLFTQSLLTDLDPEKHEGRRRSTRCPAQLAYVEKGIAPVLLAQPVYQWGYVGVQHDRRQGALQEGSAGDHHPDGAGARHQGEPRRLGAAAEGVGLHRRRPKYLRYPRKPGAAASTPAAGAPAAKP